ncbi:MAG: RagB/SusD family nutrient uptake outer membrane protein [Bacteroidetes bacterium]|nr:RagB/SusD family nutrient uptake outer membrane protein [Bacteroidota bacterium]
MMIKRLGIYMGAILAGVLLMTSCGEDDVLSINLDPIPDAEGADSYIQAIYGGLSDKNIFTDAFVVMPLLFSDNCFYAGTQNGSWEQASQFDIDPANDVLFDMYDDLYDINASLNYLITQMDTSIDETLTDDVKDGFRAEARAMRAMVYYYLANYWGTVPVITESNELADSLLLNSTKQELFDLMEGDLLYAETNISKNTYIGDDNERIRGIAVQAWLARLYLWNGDWLLAKDAALNVVNSLEVNLEDSISDIYNTSSDEHVQIVTESQSGQSLAVWFLQTFSNGQYVVRPRASIPFEANDARRNVALSVPGTTIHKYKDIASNADPVYLIRKAEMYLTAAEAIVRLTSDYFTASIYLNVVRVRAGLEEVELNAGNFEEVILQERNAELCYEGAHRLFDLRRFDKATEILGPFGYESEDDLWPFPENILEDFKSLEQNPGYE